MKLLIIIVLVAIVGVGGYFLYRSNSQKYTVTAPEGKAGQSTINQKSDAGVPAEKGNFSQKGNLSVQEDGLYLVWGEPGNPAANAKLKFTQQSTCILGGEEKDCGILSKNEGNYYVNVEGNKSGDEVTVVKVEEQKLPQ